jgi:SAM-dependent methyltransferase
MLAVFSLTLFSSALLLFLVQPMIGKMITPLLGGTPAVWSTCMVFFQALLLAGYSYAHATTAWLGARKQAVLHVALLLLPIVLFSAFFPIAVNKNLISQGGDNPILGLLAVLFVSVGLPFTIVSTTAPLLQKWFASTDHPSAADPYFLYGASNLGSMLALLGYPTLVERFIGVPEQSTYWAVGYGLLVVLAIACAALMWLSSAAGAGKGPVAEAETAGVVAGAVAAVPAAVGTKQVQGARKDAVMRERGTGRGRSEQILTGPARTRAVRSEPPREVAAALSDEVTLGRRLRWVILAAVPSSLMLGATTYITTDVAAIPLLWVLPLTLYLLSFIIVFAKIPVRVQQVMVFALVAGVIGLLTFKVAPALTENPGLLWVVRLAALVGVGFCILLFKNRSPHLLHRAMVIALPLLVLLILFMMLSDHFKPDRIAYTIGLHLAVLFVTAMVCHGELAIDRPATKHLTEFFLWMSVGGVLGGLFNALVAPLVFHGIAEYPLAMMAACLLLPSLGYDKESTLGLYADLIMAGLFVLTGATLIYLRVLDGNLDLQSLGRGHWVGLLVALLMAIAVGVFFALRAKEKRTSFWLDLGLPLALVVLAVGAIWGLNSRAVWPRLVPLAKFFRQDIDDFLLLVTYGTLVVLCYTFVERSRRFGLGVGALLLASAFCGLFDKGFMYQTRSFFGVLRVETTEKTIDEDGEEVKLVLVRLVHGTTLHGMQFANEDRRDWPLTYYHRSGPIGQVFEAYNRDARRNLGVIGLGTGTMACYAREGQSITFYDIDPTVKKISYDDRTYFTYVDDARQRGAKVDLVLGDARVMMERQELTDDQKYGILVVDAFSSDAIPIHLITWEALQVYLDKLREDGILAFHISNRYLNLEPVLANLAKKAGLAGLIQHSRGRYFPGRTDSSWVMLARKPEYLDRLLHRQEQLREIGLAAGTLPLYVLYKDLWKPLEEDEKVGTWTDNFSNLLSVFDPEQKIW